MQPLEKCQTRRLADADVASLCFTCDNRPSCPTALASELIGDVSDPGSRQIHIVASCEAYAGPGRAGADLVEGGEDIRALLWEARVLDLCVACPGDNKDACGRHARLSQLARVAEKGGNRLRAAVITCSSTRDRLYQIGEPASK